jgi:hypothetical protein
MLLLLLRLMNLCSLFMEFHYGVDFCFALLAVPVSMHGLAMPFFVVCFTACSTRLYSNPV